MILLNITVRSHNFDQKIRSAKTPPDSRELASASAIDCEVMINANQPHFYFAFIAFRGAIGKIAANGRKQCIAA